MGHVSNNNLFHGLLGGGSQTYYNAGQAQQSQYNRNLQQAQQNLANAYAHQQQAFAAQAHQQMIANLGQPIYKNKQFMINGRMIDLQEFLDELYPEDCAEKTYLALKLTKGNDDDTKST